MIEASGLPDLVVSDEAHWLEFIEHGQLLHCGDDATQFNVDWLTLKQKAATLRLIRTRSLLHPYEVEMQLTEEMIRAVERLAPEWVEDSRHTSADMLRRDENPKKRENLALTVAPPRAFRRP